MLNKSRKLGSNLYPLHQAYSVSPKIVVDVCHMSRTIAYHLLKDGEASYSIALFYRPDLTYQYAIVIDLKI
jgi:hypothetical protein